MPVPPPGVSASTNQVPDGRGPACRRRGTASGLCLSRPAPQLVPGGTARPPSVEGVLPGSQHEEPLRTVLLPVEVADVADDPVSGPPAAVLPENWPRHAHDEHGAAGMGTGVGSLEGDGIVDDGFIEVDLLLALRAGRPELMLMSCHLPCSDFSQKLRNQRHLASSCSIWTTTSRSFIGTRSALLEPKSQRTDCRVAAPEHGVSPALPPNREALGGGAQNRTGVEGFAGPCLNHSATPPCDHPNGRLRARESEAQALPWAASLGGATRGTRWESGAVPQL